MANLDESQELELEEDHEQEVSQQNDFDADTSDDEVDVDVDLEQIDDLAMYAKAQTLKKRKAFAQAKKERLARVAAENKLKEELEKNTLEEQERLNKLNADLEAERTRLQELESQLQQERLSKKDMEFKYTAEKHGVKDVEFLQYKFIKKMNSIEGDEEKMKEFTLDGWLGELKTENPDYFKGSEPAPKPNSGLNNMNNATPQATYNQSVANAKMTEQEEKNAWEEYKKNLQGV